MPLATTSYGSVPPDILAYIHVVVSHTHNMGLDAKWVNDRTQFDYSPYMLDKILLKYQWQLVRKMLRFVF